MDRYTAAALSYSRLIAKVMRARKKEVERSPKGLLYRDAEIKQASYVVATAEHLIEVLETLPIEQRLDESELPF